MSVPDSAACLVPGVDPDDVLLTRTEASEYLLTLGIRMKPATLARAYSTGSNGPPCAHVRGRPRYPRNVLREWAAQQVTRLRSSSREGAIYGPPGGEEAAT